MKKSLLTTLLLVCSLLAYCEITDVYPYNNKAAYQLYPTQNRWTFLKLNTTNGEIWIVQYSTGDDYNTMEYPLSTEDLNISKSDAQIGRYILYPTQNMFNFIMLDQVDGRTWQVQWNQEKEHRFIQRIYKSYQ